MAAVMVIVHARHHNRKCLTMMLAKASQTTHRLTLGPCRSRGARSVPCLALDVKTALRTFPVAPKGARC
eukprot:3836551-Alexandrium_andersonii.AAC.1